MWYTDTQFLFYYPGDVYYTPVADFSSFQGKWDKKEYCIVFWWIMEACLELKYGLLHIFL